MKICTAQGCQKHVRARGLCNTHYSRWRIHGDPEKLINIRGNDALRFWSKVRLTDDCWLMDGTKTRHGHMRFSLGTKKIWAHRYAYEEVVGPIPKGLVLDHLCGVPACVNPLHLEPVPPEENTRRYHKTRRTCKWGHPRDLSRPGKWCVHCKEIWFRAYENGTPFTYELAETLRYAD